MDFSATLRFYVKSIVDKFRVLKNASLTLLIKSLASKIVRVTVLDVLKSVKN